MAWRCATKQDGPDDCQEPPEDGVYCRGLFFDGGAWDYENHTLTEAPAKVLYTDVPIIWMIPMQQSDFSTFNHYSCPMYKTSERRGILSTTGHSTNHVMNCRIPSAVDKSHWVLRGLAMLTALSD